MLRAHLIYRTHAHARAGTGRNFSACSGYTLIYTHRKTPEGKHLQVRPLVEEMKNASQAKHPSLAMPQS